MGSKLAKEKSTNIDDVDIPLLIRMSNDFTTATDLVEQDAVRRGFHPKKKETVLDWLSLKTVSHFNLGTALELMLKLLLLRYGQGYKDRHGLIGLYLAIPKKIQKSLGETFQGSIEGITCSYIAVREKNAQQRRLKNRPISTIRDILEYFDKDMKIDQKRYTWEPAQKRQWRHFIDDPSVFVVFIRRVLKEEVEKINHESRAKPGGTETKKQARQA